MEVFSLLLLLSVFRLFVSSVQNHGSVNPVQMSKPQMTVFYGHVELSEQCTQPKVNLTTFKQCVIVCGKNETCRVGYPNFHLEELFFQVSFWSESKCFLCQKKSVLAIYRGKDGYPVAMKVRDTSSETSVSNVLFSDDWRHLLIVSVLPDHIGSRHHNDNLEFVGHFHDNIIDSE